MNDGMIYSDAVIKDVREKTDILLSAWVRAYSGREPCVLVPDADWLAKMVDALPGSSSQFATVVGEFAGIKVYTLAGVPEGAWLCTATEIRRVL